MKFFLRFQVMKNNIYYLCDHLNYDRHCYFLLSKRLLTHDDDEEIRQKPNRKEKVLHMLHILIRGPPTAFDSLCASIMIEKTQTFVVTRLQAALKEAIGQWKKCKGKLSLSLFYLTKY